MPIHNLNHVNMFLQVIASGSISSAARILRKSHTAVSSAVSNLEIDLCVELVRRDGYKVEPTEQALRLIPYMRSLLNYQQLIGDIAFNLNKGPRNLRVLLDTAIPPSFCDTVSSVLLDDFNMVSLIRTSPADSLATIKQDNAEIDIAITIDEELKISRFNQCVLGYTKAFVVAHPQHPLCNASLHSIASLANYRQISLGSRSGQHSNLLRPVSDKVLFVENFDDMLRVYCYYNTALESERSFLRFLESARQRLRELGRQRFDDAPAWQPSIVETAQRLQAGQAMQASPLVRMRLFLGEAPVQGVAVTQAGDLGRTGLAQRRQQGASVGVQRPQHHIAPPALDAQAAGKDRHATPRSLAVHVEAVEQHPVGAGHAPDRQRLRHQRAVLQTFFQSIANPAHEPPPRAHGRLACATLARNGMFIIDNPPFPQLRPLPSAAIAAMDVPSQSRGSAWRERISLIRRILPRCSSPGRKSTLCPPQARCSSSLSSSRDSPMDWRQSNRRHRRRHSV